MILSGNIYITTNLNTVLEAYNMNTSRIIDLDESNNLGLDPRYRIPGTILLPPPEAIVAEIDGDEQKYDYIYSLYLSSDAVQEYMASIIAYLYRGGKLLLYFPDSDYNNTLKKLIYFIFNIYGIHIGLVGDNGTEGSCFFDADKEFFQIDLMFIYTNIIGWKEYLYLYPVNLIIPTNILNILLNQINPYGETYEEKLNVIQRIRIGLKNNKNMICPIESIRRY